MKDFKKLPFKQDAIAIGFTVSVHVIAIVGLLYLGMSKPPEPPKQIKTVLIKPEDLQPVREVTEFEETTHNNVAKEITQTAEPSISPAPVIPTPAPTINQNKAAAEAKAAAQAENAQKADAAAKAKADATAKAKADATAKANADAKAKADAAAKADTDAKASSAKKAAEEASNKKAESKKIASSAKKDFESKIYRTWDTPAGSAGKRATARVTLSDNGTVQSVVVNASDPDMKASIEAAVRSAAPYPMPSDPDARREARTFTSTFISK